MGLIISPLPDEELQLETLIEAGYRLCDDGIWRFRDLDLATWVGLERPRDIRDVLKDEDNIVELEKHGSLRIVTANPGPEGGRPSSEYWLNDEQALRYCMWSRGPKAMLVQTIMARVVVRVAKGYATASRMDQRMIQVMAEAIVPPICDRIITPVLKEQREFHQNVLSQLNRHGSELSTVSREVRDIKRVINFNRFDLKQEDRKIHNAVILLRYGGLCPCCLEVRILNNDGTELPDITDDHFYRRDQRGLKFTWRTDGKCNERLKDPSFHDTKDPLFKTFQKWIDKYLRDEEMRLEAQKPQLKIDFN